MDTEQRVREEIKSRIKQEEAGFKMVVDDYMVELLTLNASKAVHDVSDETETLRLIEHSKTNLCHLFLHF